MFSHFTFFFLLWAYFSVSIWETMKLMVLYCEELKQDSTPLLTETYNVSGYQFLPTSTISHPTCNDRAFQHFNPYSTQLPKIKFQRPTIPSPFIDTVHFPPSYPDPLLTPYFFWAIIFYCLPWIYCNLFYCTIVVWHSNIFHFLGQWNINIHFLLHAYIAVGTDLLLTAQYSMCLLCVIVTMSLVVET